MQVILMERVAKLGQMGDVVDVKSGYARNYLLPQGKALTASKYNIAQFETQKAQLEARNLDTRTEAEDLASRLDGQTFIVIRSASDSGALYGSVTPRDAAEVASEGGFSVERKQITSLRPIKELGLHEMNVRLHPEVAATIVLNERSGSRDRRVTDLLFGVQSVRICSAAECVPARGSRGTPGLFPVPGNQGMA